MFQVKISANETSWTALLRVIKLCVAIKMIYILYKAFGNVYNRKTKVEGLQIKQILWLCYSSRDLKLFKKKKKLTTTTTTHTKNNKQAPNGVTCAKSHTFNESVWITPSALGRQSAGETPPSPKGRQPCLKQSTLC